MSKFNNHIVQQRALGINSKDGVVVEYLDTIYATHPYTIYLDISEGIPLEDLIEQNIVWGTLTGSSDTLSLSISENNNKTLTNDFKILYYESDETVIQYEERHYMETESRKISYHSTTKEVSDAIVEKIKTLAPTPKQANNGVNISFWYYKGGMGRQTGTIEKKIRSNPWEEIRYHYSQKDNVRHKLDTLISSTPSRFNNNGSLIILNGPPGSGKTNFIRALANSWKGWCKTHYILSPMNFMQSEGCLIDLIAEATGQNNAYSLEVEEDGGISFASGMTVEKEQWHLIVMEDASLFMDEDASRLSGGFSSFLNLTDGLLGNGLKVLFLLTSNEHIHDINKALTRPGRLTAYVTIGELEEKECREFLESHGKDPDILKDERILAELYSLVQPPITDGVQHDDLDERKIGFVA